MQFGLGSFFSSKSSISRRDSSSLLRGGAQLHLTERMQSKWCSTYANGTEIKRTRTEKDYSESETFAEGSIVWKEQQATLSPLIPE